MSTVAIYTSNTKIISNRDIAFNAQCLVHLAKNGYDFVFGGVDSGTMKLAADIGLAGNNKVTGVNSNDLMERLIAYESEHPKYEFIVLDHIGQRRLEMFDRAENGIVGLMGGLGSIEEDIEVIRWMEDGDHNKPFIFASADGYWDPIHDFLKELNTRGVISNNTMERVVFTDTPSELSSAIEDLNKVPPYPVDLHVLESKNFDPLLDSYPEDQAYILDLESIENVHFLTSLLLHNQLNAHVNRPIGIIDPDGFFDETFGKWLRNSVDKGFCMETDPDYLVTGTSRKDVEEKIAAWVPFETDPSKKWAPLAGRDWDEISQYFIQAMSLNGLSNGAFKAFADHQKPEVRKIDFAAIQIS